MTARDESGLCGVRSFPERTGWCLARKRGVPRQALWRAGCGGMTWCLGAGGRVMGRPPVFSAETKIWIVLSVLPGEITVAGWPVRRRSPVTQHASRSGVPRILWAATRDELIELVKHNSVSCWRRSAAGSARSRPWRGIFGRFPGKFASLNPSLSSRPRHSTGITSYVRLPRIFVVLVRRAGFGCHVGGDCSVSRSSGGTPILSA